MTGDRIGGTGGAWLGDYTRQAVDYWQRVARTSAETAARWGDRSLADGEWTVDTVTADLIETWEELTPLMGEGLELWLQLVQATLRGGRFDG